MTSLSCFFALRSDDRPLNTQLVPPAGVQLSLDPVLLDPAPDDELQGPHATAFHRAHGGAATLMSVTSDSAQHPETFFAHALELVRTAVRARQGWVLDVLKLWPTPFSAVNDELPEEPFADDLFSLAVRNQGDHGIRVETAGMAKLGQRELTFSFTGAELLPDAHTLCTRFAEFAMSLGRPLADHAVLNAGFDRISLRQLDGGGEGPFRGWHPPLVQRLLTPQRFKGVGVASLSPVLQPGQKRTDLTEVLERARQQRQFLEQHGLEGESPHQDTTAQVCPELGQTEVFETSRHDPASSKDSGWVFGCGKRHSRSELSPEPLGQLIGRFPQLLKYLALPTGSRVTMRGDRVSLDIPTPQPDPDEISNG